MSDELDGAGEEHFIELPGAAVPGDETDLVRAYFPGGASGAPESEQEYVDAEDDDLDDPYGVGDLYDDDLDEDEELSFEEAVREQIDARIQEHLEPYEQWTEENAQWYAEREQRQEAEQHVEHVQSEAALRDTIQEAARTIGYGNVDTDAVIEEARPAFQLWIEAMRAQGLADQQIADRWDETAAFILAHAIRGAVDRRITDRALGILDGRP
jgi:hypothetical protein